jgi:hypothetical protein
MSRSNGNGLPLLAAIKAHRVGEERREHRRQLAIHLAHRQ